MSGAFIGFLLIVISSLGVGLALNFYIRDVIVSTLTPATFWFLLLFIIDGKAAITFENIVGSMVVFVTAYVSGYVGYLFYRAYLKWSY